MMNAVPHMRTWLKVTNYKSNIKELTSTVQQQQKNHIKQITKYLSIPNVKYYSITHIKYLICLLSKINEYMLFFLIYIYNIFHNL